MSKNLSYPGEHLLLQQNQAMTEPSISQTPQQQQPFSKMSENPSFTEEPLLLPQIPDITEPSISQIPQQLMQQQPFSKMSEYPSYSGKPVLLPQIPDMTESSILQIPQQPFSKISENPSYPGKPLLLPQIQAMTEPSISQIPQQLMHQQQFQQLMQQQQLQQQQFYKLQQQYYDYTVKNISNCNNFRGGPMSLSYQMQQNINNQIRLMRQQQQQLQQWNSAINGQTSSGGINSSQQLLQQQNNNASVNNTNIYHQQTQMEHSQQQMVQPLQQTGQMVQPQQQMGQMGSHNLTSQFRANGVLSNAQGRMTPAQLTRDLSLQYARAAIQGQNAKLSVLAQSGQPCNGTFQQPFSKHMLEISSHNSASHILYDQQLLLLFQRKQQQILQQKLMLESQKMLGPGDQKSVSLIGSQPDYAASGTATTGGSSSHGPEASNQFLRKRKTPDQASQVTALPCTLAKDPKSSTLESKDVLLHPGGSIQENSKASVRGVSDCQPQAVYCHCGLEATVGTSKMKSNRDCRFWCCNELGARRCAFFQWCDPEMCGRYTEIIPRLLKRMNAQDATIDELGRCTEIIPGLLKRMNAQDATIDDLGRCTEIIPGLLKRMNAQDATINDLKIRHRELCMALMICVLVMLFMMWARLFEW